MPLYTLGTVFFVDPLLRARPALLVYLLVVLSISTLGAAISLFLMFRRGVIGDLEIRQRGERTRPFLVVWMYYVLALYVLSTDRGVEVPEAVLGMLRGVVLAIGVAIPVTLRFKMSMHTMGVGGAVGAALGLGLEHGLPVAVPLSAWILVAGLVGWARLAQGVHTEREVLVGFCWGAAAVFFSV